jgi:acetolactate synthase I/II/III large subunit
MKLSDYIFRCVAERGVKHVFYLPGGGAMHLVDSLGRCRGIEPVCMIHEQAAAIAAEAYARVTNNLGVILVTTGPGGTNAVTGLAGAWIESTPCLFISGQVKRADMMGDSGVRQMGPQEVDIVSVVRPLVKYAVTVMDPATIRYHIEKALHIAHAGRPGPVWIDVPLDVQAAQVEPDELKGFDPAEMPGPPDAARVGEWADQTVSLLNQAERPVILAGNGVRLAGAMAEFRRLVDLLGMPVLTTRTNGLDLLPYDHPLYVGRPGSMAGRAANFALQNSDVLLSIGARLDLVQVGYDHRNFARAARKIMVDIDPAEIRKMKMPIDVPAAADAGAFIREMLGRRGRIAPRDRAAWVGRCRRWKEAYPIVLPEHRSLTRYVSTYFLSEVLSAELAAADLVVPCSSGAGVEIFFMAFRAKEGQRAFLTGGLGAMGFGLPAAIGGCIAAGGVRTVLVDGDGGFQLNIQELATLAKRQLPIKIFVLNNQGYASIRTMQRNHFAGRLVGSDAASGLALPDVVRVAAAYGLASMRIENQHDLAGQVRSVLETPGPVLCDVMIDPNEVRMPTLSSAVRPDGSIVSKPLEDLWPFLPREEFLANKIIPPLKEGGATAPPGKGK